MSISIGLLPEVVSTKARYTVSLLLDDATATFVALVAVVAVPSNVPAVRMFVLGL